MIGELLGRVEHDAVHTGLNQLVEAKAHDEYQRSQRLAQRHLPGKVESADRKTTSEHINNLHWEVQIGRALVQRNTDIRGA